MQTLNSISKRYQINDYGESYYTLEISELTTGHAEAFTVFGDLDSIVSMMDCSIFSAFGESADPAQYRAVISRDDTDLVVMPTCAGPDDAVIVAPKPAGHTYEVREIDAWMYDDSWVWNTSYHLGEFTTTGDVSRAFRKAIKRLGVTFYRGRTVTVYDGDVYEIQDRTTGEPLFAAIPQEA